MKYLKYKTLKEHIAFVTKAFGKRLAFYRERDLELTPQAHTHLWSNRRYMVNIISKAMLANFEMTDDSPQLSKWRHGSHKTSMVTRIVISVLSEQSSATWTELCYRCEKYASRESVRKCLSLGVELGLLEKDEEDHYQITDLLAHELFDRSIMRLRHPDVVEAAQFCVTLNNMEQYYQNPKFPRSEEHPLSTPITINEALQTGVYGDEPFALEDS